MTTPLEVTPKSPRRDDRFALITFGVVAAVLTCVVALSVVMLPMAARVHSVGAPGDGEGPWQAFPRAPWLDGWARWDAGWYWRIAENGYSFSTTRQSPAAFFPFYPMLMRWTSALFGGPLQAGIAITVASGAVAVVLFGRWCGRTLESPATRASILVLVAYPYAFFLFGAAYSDALYLALVVAAFMLLENGHPVLAGAVGGLATATRPVGLALLVGLVVRILEQRLRADLGHGGTAESWPTRLHRLRPGDAGVLLSGAGLAGFTLLLWHRFGAPLAFVAAQRHWRQAPGFATWLKLEFWKIFQEPHLDVLHVTLAVQCALTVGFLALLPAVRRRFGLGYTVYAAATILIPAVSSADFMGMGRYLLAAFPCFAVAGRYLATRPLVRTATLLGSGSGIVLASSSFACWYYVS